MSAKRNSIYMYFLNWGIILFAVSIVFSITLMNIAFILLTIAFLIRVFKKDIEYISTGLEIPLLIFVLFYFISSALNPHPVKSIRFLLDNYWYILHMYLVIYLFGEKEINKFMGILGWAAVGLGIYTILQSFVGLNFNLNFQIGDKIRMAAPVLKKATHFGEHVIYLGSGIMGQHRTFGGQILMLTFFTYGVFREKWKIIITCIALFLSFIYSIWLGFLFSIIFIILLRKKKLIYSLILFCLFGLFMSSNLYLNKEKINSWKTSVDIFQSRPVRGFGAGGKNLTPILKEKNISHCSSIYIDILMQGGVLTFCAFMFLIFRFFVLYLNLPPQAKGKWKRIHVGCLLGVAGILFSGLFRNYLTDAQNAVLFWTLTGLIVKIKLSKWNQPVLIYSDYSGYEDIELFI
jgi:hypothetical protein